jgi:hypothetical protein
MVQRASKDPIIYAMKSTQQMWLKNRVWDTIFIMGGIWLLPIIALFSALPQSFLLLSLLLTAVLWLSHRVATFFTIFFTPSYRTLIATEPIRFIVVPTLVLLLSIAFAVSPFPESPLVRLQFMGTIFILFNTYHFGVQHFGVLTIYRIKAGQQMPDSMRDREKMLCLTLGGALVLIGQLLHGADVVRESLLSVAIPSHDISILRGIGIVASLLAGGLSIRDELFVTPSSPPKLVYKIALTIQAIAAFILPALPFLILWAVQHWLVSVGLALQMTSNSARTETQPETGLWWRMCSSLNRRPLVSGAILGAFSIIFTPLLLLPTKVVSGATSGTEIPLLVEWFAQHETATLVLIGLNFGSVFCHFLYDRAVFRFSHTPTRATSGRLLFSEGGE